MLKNKAIRSTAAAVILCICAALCSCGGEKMTAGPDSFIVILDMENDGDLYCATVSLADNGSDARDVFSSTSVVHADSSPLSGELWFQFCTQDLNGRVPENTDFLLSFSDGADGTAKCSTYSCGRLEFDAQYGNTYRFSVTGSPENGYTAVPE